MKFSPYITDAVVIGDRRAFLTALVMIDHENVEKFAQDNSIPFSNYMSLCRRPEIQELIEGEIARVNAKFARVEKRAQVSPDRAEAHRRGRGIDAHHEAQAQAGKREIPRADREHVTSGSGLKGRDSARLRRNKKQRGPLPRFVMPGLVPGILRL